MEVPTIQMSLSLNTLLERGVYCFQQQQYSEGATLFSLASNFLSPDLEQLSTFLELVTRECAKYTRLQQELCNLGVQYVGLTQELAVSMDLLLALEAQLLAEVNTIHGVEQQTEKQPLCSSGIYAVCLAPFEIRRNGSALTLCSNRNGQAILRYLIAQPERRATVDTLVGLFWPEDAEEVALHKLHIAVSLLRQSLHDPTDPDQKYLLYKQRTYYLNPAVVWHSDVEEFLTFYTTGRKLSGQVVISCYEKACALYTQSFLLEDLFADWSFLHREHLRQIHEKMCNALAWLYLEDGAYETAMRWAFKIIEENNCDEAAYRLLMAIYALDGRHHEAIQMYRRCTYVLSEELDTLPRPETEMLYQAILQGNQGTIKDSIEMSKSS